jgi:hypothetical protein
MVIFCYICPLGLDGGDLAVDIFGLTFCRWCCLHAQISKLLLVGV